MTDDFLHLVGSFVTTLHFLKSYWFLPIFLSSLHSPAFKVSISGTRVELTCPEDPDSEQIKWEKDGVLIPDHHDEHLLLDNFSEMKDSGHYTCYRDNSNNNRNYLYLKARGNAGLQRKHS